MSDKDTQMQDVIIEGIQSRLAVLESRIAGQSVTIGGLNSAVGSLSGRLTDSAERESIMNTYIVQIEQRVKELEAHDPPTEDSKRNQAPTESAKQKSDRVSELLVHAYGIAGGAAYWANAANVHSEKCYAFISDCADLQRDISAFQQGEPAEDETETPAEPTLKELERDALEAWEQFLIAWQRFTESRRIPTNDPQAFDNMRRSANKYNDANDRLQDMRKCKAHS